MTLGRTMVRSVPEGNPAKPTERNEQAADPPGGDDQKAGAGEAGTPGVRVIGDEQGGCQVTGRGTGRRC